MIMTRILKSIKLTSGLLEAEIFQIAQSLDLNPTENLWNLQISNIFILFFVVVFLFTTKASDKTCYSNCSCKQNQM